MLFDFNLPNALKPVAVTWSRGQLRMGVDREHQDSPPALQVEFMLLHFLCSQVNEVIFGKVGFTTAICVNKEQITDSLCT